MGLIYSGCLSVQNSDENVREVDNPADIIFLNLVWDGMLKDHNDSARFYNFVTLSKNNDNAILGVC